MKRTVLLLLLLCSGAVSAGDLAVISINDRTQAEVATATLGHAFTRSGDRFVVVIEPENRAPLTQAGIDYQIILPDCTPDATALIYPDRGQDARRMIQTGVAGSVDIGSGLMVAPVTTASAALIESRLGARWRLLSDLSIPIAYEPPAIPTAIPLGPYPTDSLSELINMDSLRALDQRLEAFYTRYIWRDSIIRARNWMVSKFQGWGYTDVTTPQVYYGGGYHYNVKVVKLGYAEPDQVIVIGGHYDSYNQQSSGSLYAPGADDDASGTALVMEVARVLKDVPLRKTVIFMPFTAEEVGLVGSEAAAADFKANNTKLEVMLNFDMVAYAPGTFWGLTMTSGPNQAYRDVAVSVAEQVAEYSPVIGSSLGSSSDHYSFHVQGYPVVDNIETEFNTDGWHTNLDLSSRLNFPFYTEVARMAVASVARIANAGVPTSISYLTDVGDGQSLFVQWADCNSGSNYVVHWGTSPSHYTDSAAVPTGHCTYMISGLTTGVTYYVKVVEKPPDGYPSIYAVGASQTPLLVPRAPTQLVATPNPNDITLNWNLNQEADVVSYNVYRRVQGLGDFVLLETGLSSPTFADATVLAQIGYEYVITAVDFDGYESVFSGAVSCYRATFDGGVMLVDEFTQENYTLPTQAKQEAWFDTLFDQTPYAIQMLDSTTQHFNRNLAARYSSVFWVDDDNSTKLLSNNQPQWAWYLANYNNALVAGFRTIWGWNENQTIPAGHPLRESFKVSAWSTFAWPDWIGAFGQNGWPTVDLDITRGPTEMANIPVLTPVAGATVIYTYNSTNDEPGFEGQPCGLAYSGPEGKRIILSFPLWYLTPTSAHALVQRALVYFGETGTIVVDGDIDGGGTVDIGDLTILIDNLFISFQPLSNPSRADVDGSCWVDVGDLTYYILYLFLEGQAPQPGCVP